MNRYRATIWVLTSVAATFGNSGITRRIVEEQADSRDQFEARIRDTYCQHDVDCDVSFGPISVKDIR